MKYFKYDSYHGYTMIQQKELPNITIDLKLESAERRLLREGKPLKNVELVVHIGSQKNINTKLLVNYLEEIEDNKQLIKENLIQIHKN